MSEHTTTRSTRVLDADIEQHLRAVIPGTSAMLGARTANCSKLVGYVTVAPCAKVSDLRRERAASAERDQLILDLQAKRQHLGTRHGLDLAGIADPHVSVIARLFRLPADHARLAVNVAFAALLEFIGGFGLLVVSLLPSSNKISPKVEGEKPAPPSMETGLAAAQRYLTTAVRRTATGSVVASAMHRDYARWCATERVMPITLTAFGAFIAQEGITKTKVEGLVRYQNVALKSDEVSL